MDRKLFTERFTQHQSPDWMCPTCKKSVLRIDQESFSKAETVVSRKLRDHPAWDPHFIQNIYTTLLRCENSRCREVVSSSGTGIVEEKMSRSSYDSSWEESYTDYFYPVFFEPPLQIITIPETCPETVNDNIQDAFRLFFTSPSSAANSIRIAVEELLTDLKVNRYRNSNGKRKAISLHRRIENLPPKYSEIKSLAKAVKWIGNAGSHSSTELKPNDVLDGFELLENVLDKIYNKSQDELKRKASKINNRKGPLRGTK